MEEMTDRVPHMHSRETRHLLASTLQRFIDADRLTIDHLADVTGASGSTCRRWVNAEQLPDLHEARTIAAASGIDLEIRLAIVGVVLNGSPFRCESCDAVVPLSDVARHALNGAVQQAELTRHVVEAQADNFIDAAEAIEGLAKLTRAQLSLDAVRASFEKCAARGPRSVAG
jgi:hypothetical protein